MAKTPARTFPPDPLAPDELAALLSACSLRAPTGIRDHALLALLARSGLRVSEALALRPSAVSFADHSIRVLHGKGPGGPAAGKATVRYFHPSADAALARWIDVRRRLDLARPGIPLFCTLRGDHLSDNQVRAMVKRRAARAGIDKRVHPHGLRHTFARELEDAGVPVSTISKLLGHSSVAVTSRYLDHLTNAQAGKALMAIDLPPLEGI